MRKNAASLHADWRFCNDKESFDEPSTDCRMVSAGTFAMIKRACGFVRKKQKKLGKAVDKRA